MTAGRLPLLQLLVLTLLVSPGGTAKAETGEPVGALSYVQPTDTREFFVVVEIPAGSFTKYEVEPQTGLVIVDRFQQMPVVYPANYGSVASSMGGDGDHLDALVLTREPVVPGALIRVRTIGVLRMIDGGEADDKLITVPVSDVDPTYDPVQSIGDLPEIERQRIAAFFSVYKALPAGRKIVELGGFGDAAEAQALVDTAILAGRVR
jgi:inorganic pyrophosphatase